MKGCSNTPLDKWDTAEVLWSWHIWACEGYNPDATAQKYNNNAGVVMDRNLGATSATPGKPQTIGLLYQWGRKDPFLSGGKELRSQSFSAFMWIGTSVTPCSGGARSFACNVRCVKIAVE